MGCSHTTAKSSGIMHASEVFRAWQKERRSPAMSQIRIKNNASDLTVPVVGIRIIVRSIEYVNSYVSMVIQD